MRVVFRVIIGSVGVEFGAERKLLQLLEKIPSLPVEIPFIDSNKWNRIVLQGNAVGNDAPSNQVHVGGPR